MKAVPYKNQNPLGLPLLHTLGSAFACVNDFAMCVLPEFIFFVAFCVLEFFFGGFQGFGGRVCVIRLLGFSDF